jgi:uncharacterized membrane protein
MIKKLTVSKVHFSTIILYVAYVGFPITFSTSIALLLTGYEVKDMQKLKDFSFFGVQILFTSLSAISACFAQISLNISYKYDDASKISAYRTMEIIFTYALQFIFLNINPGLMSHIG